MLDNFGKELKVGDRVYFNIPGGHAIGAGYVHSFTGSGRQARIVRDKERLDCPNHKTEGRSKRSHQLAQAYCNDVEYKYKTALQAELLSVEDEISELKKLRDAQEILLVDKGYTVLVVNTFPSRLDAGGIPDESRIYGTWCKMARVWLIPRLCLFGLGLVPNMLGSTDIMLLNHEVIIIRSPGE